MKILFIGNSHTYGYGMPYQCREMMKAQRGEVYVGMIAQPGQTLTWHSENPATRLALRYEDWDHIILQQATHPFHGHPELKDAVNALLRLMQGNRSVWFYKTWCEKEIHGNQVIIDQAFKTMSDELRIPVIPVSDVWHAVEQRDPGHALYDADGKHAGAGGSYLTALCMARALSRKSVAGLPAVLKHGDTLINQVPPSHAELYQRVVMEIMG
ncbi:MAG TPA: hypothetical protein DCS43_13255 [Verrucomicrobia bacterium]|nr:hypothetical protein [Verrucomicrobiota bacterium]